MAFDRLPSVGTNASTTKSTRTRPNGLKVVKPTFLGRLVSTIESQENESSPRKIPEDSCYLRPKANGTRAQLHFHKRCVRASFAKRLKMPHLYADGGTDLIIPLYRDCINQRKTVNNSWAVRKCPCMRVTIPLPPDR